MRLTAKSSLVGAFHAYCKGPRQSASETCPYGFLASFLRQHGSVHVSQMEMNRVRMHLRLAFGLHRQGHLARLGSYLHSGRSAAADRRVRFSERRRRPAAGRLPIMALVRELLFEWFCSLRRAVKARIPAAVLQVKTASLVRDHVLADLRWSGRSHPPRVSASWLQRWRLEHGVSLRKPNRRYKVSHSVLLERMRIGWSNIFRVRALCLHAHGYDMDMANFDQSPFHMNEAGCKAEGSLTLRGAPAVALKECHAATRKRWTANTTCTSSSERAALCPPLEVMFKAEGEILAARLQGLVPPWAPWLTVATGPRGS